MLARPFKKIDFEPDCHEPLVLKNIFKKIENRVTKDQNNKYT